MPSRIALRLWGSTATVGSSRMMSSGAWTMPQAILSRRSRPPESLAGLKPVNLSSSTKAIASSTRRRRRARSCTYRAQKASTFWATVSSSKTATSCGTMPIRRLRS